ncbi:MAG TPA: hypothetical protein ENJ23_04080 [Bacteroidetes bacterium]|nr:hypothetical protein [Bacteroidota bacterium]
MPLQKTPSLSIDEVSQETHKFLERARAALLRTESVEELVRAYRSLFRRVVPLQGAAFLTYDAERKVHELRDIFPAELKPAVLKQIEEGIITWASSSGEVLASETALPAHEKSPGPVIFVPLSRNGFYGGIIELFPGSNRANLNAQQVLRLEILRTLFADQLHCLELERQKEELEQQIERIQNRLEHVDRLASLGELAGSIAHEINNPLTTILGRVQLLLLDRSIPEQARERLQKVEKQGIRVAELIKALLNFARQTPDLQQTEPVDVGDLIRETARLVRHSLEIEGIEFRLELAENLPELRVNPTHLQQILINLINNAAHAMEDGGTLTVRAHSRGNEVHIQVRDTGCGIRPEDLPHIFEPFYTTRLGSGGTGLGLAICRQIAQRYGGRFEVQSEVGKGTAFTVIFPVQPDHQNEE